MKSIVLAGGCFWGVEEYFSRIPGVTNTTVGYANGTTKAPTYKEVCTGLTGHAEVVRLQYDEQLVTLNHLLNKYWAIVDPTILNRQGPDKGTQYRTGIFYEDFSDLSAIEESVLLEQSKYAEQIVTEVLPLTYFFDAEEYHQDYLKKNPHGYCHIKLD